MKTINEKIYIINLFNNICTMHASADVLFIYIYKHRLAMPDNILSHKCNNSAQHNIK